MALVDVLTQNTRRVLPDKSDDIKEGPRLRLQHPHGECPGPVTSFEGPCDFVQLQGGMARREKGLPERRLGDRALPRKEETKGAIQRRRRFVKKLSLINNALTDKFS